MQLTRTELRFRNLIVGVHRKPHALQEPGKTWRSVDRHSNDLCIRRHLQGRESLGLPSPWYLHTINMDLDRVRVQMGPALDRLMELGIRNDQILIVSSPRHETNGNCRIYLKTVCNCRPATFRLNAEVFRPRFFVPVECPVEVYPQLNRFDRQPCGFGSKVLDIDGRVIAETVEDQLDMFEALEETAIEDLPDLRLDTRPDKKAEEEDREDMGRLLKGEALAELRHYGLEAKSSRHDAQFQLLYALWNEGVHPDVAVAEVLAWVQLKHNGFSAEARAGNWNIIRGEIERQAKKIWRDYRLSLPDGVQNWFHASTAEDLARGAKLFPGDAVQQKRFFHLLGHMRPKIHHGAMFISAKQWRTLIASGRTYSEFQQDLVRRGLLEIDPRYVRGMRSRRYRLKGIQLEKGGILQRNGRNVDDFYEALWVTHKGSIPDIVEATSIDRTTVWRNLSRLQLLKQS